MGDGERQGKSKKGDQGGVGWELKRRRGSVAATRGMDAFTPGLYWGYRPDVGRVEAEQRPSRGRRKMEKLRLKNP